jgi:hypothetical protein
LLGYGITESLKVSISAPVIIRAEGLAPARVAGFTPMGSDLEGLLTWRFQRRDTGVGSRFESTAIGGVLKSDGHPAGFYSGVVSGLASRSHYAWGGVSYQRYGAGKDQQRPDILSYSAVYGYRPHSWRTDYPRWDWRVFGEMTGERAGTPVRPSQQVFVGPTTLGIYKQYAISGGIQFPVYQSVSPVYPRERFRFAINFTYFF